MHNATARLHTAASTALDTFGAPVLLLAFAMLLVAAFAFERALFEGAPDA